MTSTLDPITVVEASLQRCSADAQFLHRFYERFLARDPRIPPLFANTRFERQTKLLRHALGLVVAYAKRANPALLERVAARHGRSALNVPLDLFDDFLDALVETVEATDPECTPEVLAAWRAATQPAVDFMIAHHAG